MTGASRSLAVSAERAITSSARAIEAAIPLLPDAGGVERLERIIGEAIARGYFEPDEDAQVKRAFHDYLTARSIIWPAIAELRSWVADSGGDSSVQLRAFVVAYAGACVLVWAGRSIMDRLAADPVVRRKLDEAGPERGIPPKQLTTLYRALTSPVNAWRLRWAREFAKQHGSELEALAADPILSGCYQRMKECEHALDIPVRNYLLARLRYRWHAGRRKGASAFQRAMFGLFEVSGRAIANARSPWYRKRINATVRQKLAAFLEPGDVVVTRHHDAMSNLFLPGYWPHAALHIGTEEQRRTLGLEIGADRGDVGDPVRVLEARKDGVLFRELEDTLNVDAVVVIRPQLPPTELLAGLSRAVTHAGKLYDFSFDFFRSDRIVCTEVVYRAFDGVGPVKLRLTERAGRPTLSAEDLLDAAIDGLGFQPVAIFGTPLSRRRVVFGDEVRELLIQSYR